MPFAIRTSPVKIQQQYHSIYAFSGTCDPMRQHVGYYYFHVTIYSYGMWGFGDGTVFARKYGSSTPSNMEPMGSYNEVSAYDTKDILSYPLDLKSIYDFASSTSSDASGRYTVTSNPIRLVQINENLIKVTGEEIPRVTIPFRIIGNEDLIINDAHWRTMVMGGTFNTSSYDGFYNTSVYTSYKFTCDFGYDELDAKYNSYYGCMNDLYTNSITYKYNYYDENYQTYSEQTHERMLPNLNLMAQSYKNAINPTQDPEQFLPQQLYKSIAWDRDTYTAIFQNAGIGDVDRDVPPRTTSKRLIDISRGSRRTFAYTDPFYKVSKFLSSSYAETNLSDDEKQYVNTANKTVYFTSGSIRQLKGVTRPSDTMHPAVDNFPSFVQIKIPVQPDNIDGYASIIDGSLAVQKNVYTSVLGSEELQEEVLSYIYNTFTYGQQGGGQVESMPLNRQTIKYKYDVSKMTSSIDVSGWDEPTNNMLNTDVPQMLLQIANQNTLSNNSIVLSDNAEQVIRMRNTDGSYRYSKSYPALKALQNILEKMSSNLKRNFASGDSDVTDNFFEVLNRIDQSQHVSYAGGIEDANELLGYRIAKKAGNPIGDNRNSEVLQNFMFFNNGVDSDLTVDGEHMYFCDSQVKYGKDYTYEIYAYYVVPGYRYRYGDIRLSNYIGETEGSADGEDHCIEFRDPNTDTPVEQLLNTETNLEHYTLEPYTDGATLFTNESRYSYYYKDYTDTPSPLRRASIQKRIFLFDLFTQIYLFGNQELLVELSKVLNIDLSLLHSKHRWVPTWDSIRYRRTEAGEDGHTWSNYLKIEFLDQMWPIVRYKDAIYTTEATPDFLLERETARLMFAMDTLPSDDPEVILASLSADAASDHVTATLELFFAAMESRAGRNPNYFIDKYKQFCEENPYYQIPTMDEIIERTRETESIFSLTPVLATAEASMNSILTTVFDDYFDLTLGARHAMMRTYTDASTSATNAQIRSANKYLADLNIQIEPTLKIVQVPITTKTLKILDHPPVACDVTPYYKKDNSQTIGFYINKEAFSKFENDYDEFNTKINLFPTPISSYEFDLKEDYVISNDLLPNEYIKKSSKSTIDSVIVYRLNYRPTLMTVFDSNIVATKKMNYADDQSYSLSNCFYEEKIATNKKMYYLFKFINKNGIIGHTSQIQEVMLVDDGGYKYMETNLLHENDIIAKEEKIISTEFKKLMQIKLQPSQTALDYSGIDFAGEAASQVENIVVGGNANLVWGKRYKFRITSKKTGKKIDLNVKYNLRK